MSVTIILCAIIFIVSVAAWNKEGWFEKMVHYPYLEARDKSYYRLFTAIFLHGSWLHLLINLFVFWTFGEAIEYQFGHLFGPEKGRIYFLLLFLVSGIAGDIRTTLKHKDNPGFRSVGASGAVSGIMMAYVLFYPLQNLYLYGVIPIPGILAAVGFLWYSQYAAKREGSKIDHYAHFYGAVAGILVTILMYPPVVSHFVQELLGVLR